MDAPARHRPQAGKFPRARNDRLRACISFSRGIRTNRFNVAATRAERKLVVFCSNTVLDVVPTDRSVLLESMMLKEFRHYCCDGHTRVPWPSAEDGEILLDIQWKGF